MTAEKEKISVFQFFVMLFLTRTLTTVTYLSSYTKNVRLSDMLILPVFRIIIGTFIMVPLYFLYKKFSDKNVLDIVREKSTVAAKVLSIFYAVTFFYFSVVTIARLDVFAGTVVFPETDVNFMIVFTVIFCCYGAYLGFSALGRSSVLSACIVIPALLLIMLSLTKKVDFLNLTPVFYNGVKPVVKIALDSVGQTVEYSIIAVCVPKISGNKKKGFFVWLVLQTFLMAILFFFAASVMGNYASTQLFPFHTMASLAQFTMFDRLDAIFTGVWIMCAFIKAALLIYLIVDILTGEFEKIKRKHALYVTGILAIISNLFIASQFKYFAFIDSSYIKTAVTAVTVVLIPLGVYVLRKKGRNKKCGKAL